MSTSAPQGQPPTVDESSHLAPATTNLSTPPAVQLERPSLPGYEIEHEIGRGGMGVVYKGRQISLNRPVAIKMLPSREEVVRADHPRLADEARILARLLHPNIVQVIDVGESGGKPFIVMEFVPGGNLAQRINGTPLDPAVAAQLVELLAQAVHHVHEADVLHRDLKPANVLMTADGQPKVTDFGLAKRLDPELTGTISGMLKGTPVYMAPEQAAGKSRAIDRRTDVYGLGAILYEALTGRPPFRADGLYELLHAVVNIDPQPPHVLHHHVPADLEAICLKCLRKAPAERYATAQDLATALAGFLGISRSDLLPLPMPEGKSSGQRTTEDQSSHITAEVVVEAALPSIPVVDPRPRLHVSSPALSRNKFWLVSSVLVTVMAICGGIAWLLWPEPPSGTVQLRLSPADAPVNVEIDDHVLDMNLLATPYQLQPGKHTLVITGKGFETYRCEFTVMQGDNPILNVELKLLPVVKRDRVVDPGPPVGPPARLDEPFVGHGRPVRCVAFSADGKQAVSGGDDGKLFVWNMVTHQPFFVIPAHTQPILAVALNADGSRAVTAGADRAVRVWNLSSAAVLKPIGEMPTGSVTMSAVALSPDRDLVLFGGEDRVVRLWDLDKGVEAVKTFNGHTGTICAVAFAPNGQQLASAGEDQTIRMWDPNNTARETKKLVGHTDTVRSIAYTRDTKRLVSGGDDRIIRLWDVDHKAAAELKRFVGHSGTIRSVSFTQDDTGIVSAATGPFDNTLRYWNANTGAFLRIVGRHKDGVYAVACSRLENNRALSSGEDGVLRLWDLAATSAGSPMPTLEELVEVRRLRAPDGEKTGLNRVTVARDGRRVLTAGKDGVGRIWDAANGKELFALRETTDALYLVDFSADGKLALTGGADKKARVWNAETGALLRTFDGHQERVLCGVFTPDGQHVVTAGDGAVALLCMVKDGTIVQRYEKRHTKPIERRGPVAGR